MPRQTERFSKPRSGGMGHSVRNEGAAQAKPPMKRRPNTTLSGTARQTRAVNREQPFVIPKGEAPPIRGSGSCRLRGLPQRTWLLSHWERAMKKRGDAAIGRASLPDAANAGVLAGEWDAVADIGGALRYFEMGAPDEEILPKRIGLLTLAVFRHGEGKAGKKRSHLGVSHCRLVALGGFRENGFRPFSVVVRRRSPIDREGPAEPQGDCSWASGGLAPKPSVSQRQPH